ncbi:MAG: ABC transporter permease [Longimicrobiales bacterium]
MKNRLDRSSLTQLTLMRVREFAREPEAVFWTFFFPVVMALALGVAFRNRGPAPVSVGVVASGVAALPDSVVAAMEAAPALRVRRLLAGEAERELARGDVALVVLAEGSGYTYRYDRAREESRLARLLADDVLQREAGRVDPLRVRERPVEERGSRYIDFLIPGLIGLNLLSTGLWGVGYTVVRLRSGQLLKRFMATPMRRTEFLLSFVLGRLVFLGLELAVLLGFAWLAFDVASRGSLLAVLVICVLGAFSFTAFGLLVSSRARTTEAVSGLMNLAAVPMWILSGVFFSADNFPDAMQPFIQALPLTAFLNALRAVMLEGQALSGTGAWLALVIGWGVATGAAALAIFRWR